MNPPLENLYLLVSQQCNLTCSYCYAEGGHFGAAPLLMENATLRLALQRLLPLAKNALVISFFGGEPLLNFQRMQEAVELGNALAESRGLRLRYALTTNGTVISEEIVSFLRERIDYVSVSLDGDAAVTDGQRRFRHGRRGVHATVLDTLTRFRKAGIPFALRATITESGMEDLLETVRYFERLGASAIRLVPAFQTQGWELDQLERLAHRLHAVNRDAMRRALTGDRPAYGEQFHRLCEFLKGERRHLPCSAGSGVLAVSANGGIYPCDHFVGKSAFRMGSVFDTAWPGPEATEVRARLDGNPVEQRPGCCGCDVRHLCGGECPANSAAATGDIATPSTSHCALMRPLYRAIGKEVEHFALARREATP